VCYNKPVEFNDQSVKKICIFSVSESSKSSSTSLTSRKNSIKETLYMKSIFVGNLPWSATDAELSAKFSEHGNVISARIVTDKFTGKSRGFGFVDMEDSDAAKAITAMSGAKWGDREMTVNEAKPKSENRDRNGGGQRRSFERY
jgi:RNA recognition motif-containing protein